MIGTEPVIGAELDRLEISTLIKLARAARLEMLNQMLLLQESHKTHGVHDRTNDALLVLEGQKAILDRCIIKLWRQSGDANEESL